MEHDEPERKPKFTEAQERSYREYAKLVDDYVESTFQGDTQMKMLQWDAENYRIVEIDHKNGTIMLQRIE